jgi:hypothetical protein
MVGVSRCSLAFPPPLRLSACVKAPVATSLSSSGRMDVGLNGQLAAAKHRGYIIQHARVHVLGRREQPQLRALPLGQQHGIGDLVCKGAW